MTAKKRLSKNKILKELYFEDNLSCADISFKISKSFPVTQKLLEDLVLENFVYENGYAASTGGRRAQTYSLQKNVMYLVSVAMDQFVTKIAVMDMQNNFVSPVEKFVLPLLNNEEALPLLTKFIEEVIVSSGIPKDKIVGVGIGMPGFVNVKKGVNYTYLRLPFDKSITRYITEKIGVPAFIDNDSSLIALAELRFGASRKERNAMVINISWGVGLGLIINGEMFRGDDGFAGEFSHIPLFLNGKLCSCGKTGCIETEASLLLIVERAREGIKAGRLTKLKALPDDIEMASGIIITAAKEGDQFAVELFSRAGYDIGKGVAVLIHLLNPKTIILSGRGSSAGQIWKAPIQQALNEHCIHRLFQSTSIEISTLGTQAELIGAAALVMENYEHVHINRSEINKIGEELLQKN